MEDVGGGSSGPYAKKPPHLARSLTYHHHLEGAAGQDPAFVCDSCGGVRFVPCPACYGSRKVFVEEEGQARCCGHCNENGLVRCPNCCS